MPKKRVILAVPAVLVVAGFSVAEAKSGKPSHKLTATVVAASVKTTGTPPTPGSTSVQAGTLASSLGSGAGVSKLTFAAGSGPGTFAFTGRNTLFTAHGSIQNTLKGTGALQPNGSITFTGTLKTKGGTDRYAGAKGNGTFTGSTPAANKPVTLKFKGTIRF